MPTRPRGAQTGVTLAEVLIAGFILTLVVTALLPLFLHGMRVSKNSVHAKVSTQLAEELLEEVRLRRWDELTPTPPRAVGGFGVVGTDDGEDPADKRTFDDVDDFNGWREAPPTDPVMRPLPGFEDYHRSVAVGFFSVAGATVPANAKQLTVCAGWSTERDACLKTVVANR
jgi:hypothetical protein